MALVTPDIGTIFWMLLMFITLLVILKKFAWKPILSALENREKSIEDSLRSADRAREEMVQLKADNEKILADARLERDGMLKESRQTSEIILSEAREKAVEEGRRLIEAARVQIDNEKSSAMSEIRKQIADLSVDIAEKILREKLKDDKQQKELVDKLLQDIKLN
ncbi:MAG: F0F1 ATP synthase subunit B [Bacteroidales bacterium]|nr:F0F1 ATP synthase subunit B [Bacteroidales bacterium]